MKLRKGFVSNSSSSSFLISKPKKIKISIELDLNNLVGTTFDSFDSIFNEYEWEIKYFLEKQGKKVSDFSSAKEALLFYIKNDKFYDGKIKKLFDLINSGKKCYRVEISNEDYLSGYFYENEKEFLKALEENSIEIL